MPPVVSHQQGNKSHPRILIADDDPLSLRILEYLLAGEGFTVTVATNGAQASEILLSNEAPSLAVLDVLMPQVDGLEVCRRIRSVRPTLPPYIILLTVKDSKDDIVEGLRAGANDYVVKPFDQAELFARIGVGLQMLTLQQRLVERVNELEEALSRVKHLQGLLTNDVHVYEFGSFRLDAAEHRVTWAGRPLQLTAKVFDLLLLLVQNSGHLVRKEEIMRVVWADSEVEDNNLTVTMSLLRKTLANAGGEDEYIETISKRGYRFIAEVRRVG